MLFYNIYCKWNSSLVYTGGFNFILFRYLNRNQTENARYKQKIWHFAKCFKIYSFFAFAVLTPKNCLWKISIWVCWFYIRSCRLTQIMSWFPLCMKHWRPLVCITLFHVTITCLLFVQNKMKRYKKVVSLTQLLGALTAAQLIIPHLPTGLKSKINQLQIWEYSDSFSSAWPK